MKIAVWLCSICVCLPALAEEPPTKDVAAVDALLAWSQCAAERAADEASRLEAVGTFRDRSTSLLEAHNGDDETRAKLGRAFATLAVAFRESPAVLRELVLIRATHLGHGAFLVGALDALGSHAAPMSADASRDLRKRWIDGLPPERALDVLTRWLARSVAPGRSENQFQSDRWVLVSLIDVNFSQQPSKTVGIVLEEPHFDGVERVLLAARHRRGQLNQVAPFIPHRDRLLRALDQSLVGVAPTQRIRLASMVLMISNTYAAPEVQRWVRLALKGSDEFEYRVALMAVARLDTIEKARATLIDAARGSDWQPGQAVLTFMSTIERLKTDGSFAAQVFSESEASHFAALEFLRVIRARGVFTQALHPHVVKLLMAEGKFSTALRRGGVEIAEGIRDPSAELVTAMRALVARDDVSRAERNYARQALKDWGK